MGLGIIVNAKMMTMATPLSVATIPPGPAVVVVWGGLMGEIGCLWGVGDLIWSTEHWCRRNIAGDLFRLAFSGWLSVEYRPNMERSRQCGVGVVGRNG